jgi:hypothetical protein
VSVNEKVMEVVPPIPKDSTLFFKKIKLFLFFSKKLFSVQNVNLCGSDKPSSFGCHKTGVSGTLRL